MIEVAAGTAAGLSEIEALRRLAADGRNELLAEPPPGVHVVLARQLRETVIVVLLVAAVLTAAVGDLPDMAVILAVVVLNCALGTAQEVRSGRALAALAHLTAPRATVIRDGTARDVDAGDVVHGDVIRLGAGDVIAADAVLLSGAGLQVDEAMLTGESVPVAKAADDELFAGTVVTRGHGDALVSAVAQGTALGVIARSLHDSRTVPTPVQRQLAVLGRRLAVAVCAAGIVVAVINVLGGRGIETSVVLAISLAVAAIPESLPAVVSLSLALAARRMADRGVLTRQLAAVEALGSVTVIAADKTGTLTEGRMRLAAVWTSAGTVAAERGLHEAAVLCNDACRTASGEPGERDDPTEVALVDGARAAGLDPAEVRRRYPRIAEHPFDALAARMTTVHRSSYGGLIEICKGAPEVVVDASAYPEGALTAAGAFAEAGYRVLAVASGEPGSLHLIGLLALADPPRAEAAKAVAAFGRAGVRVVMITGDHPRTAAAIGAQLGIAADAVYARVRPERKTEIVTELRRSGEVVAMTGDGVNDAPALRAADIGVAMGGRGTEVAKQAAAIVLTGDNLGAMVPAIAEGRRAYDNLRRFLHYALSGGFAEVAIMLLGPVFGFALPLQAGQILWVNLLTHGLPGVAMGNEVAAPDVLNRPPRPPQEQLLDRATVRRVAVLGGVIAAVSLLAGAVSRSLDGPWQSGVFVTLTIAQLAAALGLRPRRHGHRSNRMLLGAVVLNVLLVLLAVWWPPLRELLRTEPIGVPELLLAVLGGAVTALVANRQRPATTSQPAS